jgi:hypothetical protein
MLRAFVATVLAALCLSGLPARSDDVPTLDVNPVCHGIAMQGELEAGLQQTSFKQCIQSEQETREQIKKEWSTFSASDIHRAHHLYGNGAGCPKAAQRRQQLVRAERTIRASGTSPADGTIVSNDFAACMSGVKRTLVRSG